MLVLGTVAYTAFVWWFATGLVLCLARRPEDWHGTLLLTLAVPTALAGLAIVAVADVTSVAAALLAFTSAIILWGWLETSFLFGHVTGPRRAACPQGVTDWQRFRLACHVLRDHELVLFGVLGLLALALWRAPNQVAFETFAALWACRLASKLILFRGVPSLSEDMLPQRMRYLATYFGRERPGPLFAVLVGGMAWFALDRLASAFGAGTPFEAVAAALVGGLVALAVLEHLLMIVPLRDSRMWSWALGQGRARMDAKEDRGRKLQGVALSARAVVPSRRGA